MSQTYLTLVTEIGTQLLASATALGKQLKLSKMAVGDGNGTTPQPSASQTKLVNEKRRAAVNNVTIDENNKNQIIIEQVIPESEGGWWIREIGLFDENNNLIAVGNCPPTYKPLLAEGSGRTQVIRMIIIVESTNSVEIKIDPSVVLATRSYVDESTLTKMTEHEKSRKHPDATTTTKGLVQLNPAINSTLTTQAATPSAVKAAYDLANTANGTANTAKATAETDATTSAKGRVQLNTATNSTSTTQAATPSAVKAAYDLASTANNNAGGKVPTSRKINNKPLTTDISLSADDTSALPASKKVANNVTTYEVGTQTNFAKVPTFANKQPIYVVESYVSDDGLSWYRKHSDGYIEQKFIFKVSTTTATAVADLLIEFKFDKNFGVAVITNTDTSTVNYVGSTVTKKQITFSTKSYSNGQKGEYLIFACGY